MTLVLPRHLEAEQAVLGAMLFDNGTFHRLPDLRAEHFFDPVHGRIFERISALIRSGRYVDGEVLRDFASADIGIKEIGGTLYLLKLMDNAAVLPTQAIAYAELISDMALRRELIAACREVASKAAIMADGADAGDILTDAMRAIYSLGEGASSAGVEWRSAAEIAMDAVERAFEGKARGISTGLPTLDDYTGGGRPGTLWVIGGATSMGKSVGGQQLAVNVARQRDHDGRPFGVAYVHLEMDNEEVGIRLASALAFDFKRINQIGEDGNPYYLSAVNQRLRPQQWERMRQAAREVAPQLKIYVDDRPGRTVTQIESATARLFQKMKRDGVTPGLIVVDHEGLIAPESGGRSMPDLEAARARSHGLKNMAKRLGVWTVALSQITKEGSRADGEDRLPTALDLNYGSALSQAAHVVILLHRKAYYAERKPHAMRSEEDIRLTRSRETTLIIDKARGGRRGHVEAIMDVASAVLIESGETA